MKKDIIKIIIIIIAILLFAYGFSEGMEWYRLAAVMGVGMLLGIAMRK